MSFVPTILLIIVCVAHDNRRNFVVFFLSLSFFLSLYHRASEMATLAATPTGGTPPKEVVAITGSAGFIGNETCLQLLELGHEVIGVDNLSTYYDVHLKEDRLLRIKSKSNFLDVRMDL